MAASALAASDLDDAFKDADRAALDGPAREAPHPTDREPAPDRAVALAAASGRRKRVVIIGAGFGGLSAARALVKAPVDVVVIDRHNYHLFQPLLYQVATAGLS